MDTINPFRTPQLLAYTTTQSLILQYTCLYFITLAYTSLHLLILHYTCLYFIILVYTSIHLLILPHTYLYYNTLTYTTTHLLILQHTYLYYNTLTYTTTHLLILPHTCLYYLLPRALHAHHGDLGEALFKDRRLELFGHLAHHVLANRAVALAVALQADLQPDSE